MLEKEIRVIKFIIDEESIRRYEKHYFAIHPRAVNPPIKQPYHESINQWMIMKRPIMNALKQKWKDYIKWQVEEEGYSNLCIEKCEIEQTIYYNNNRRHDLDNTVPKFVLDGFVESKMIVDDDSEHIQKLTLMCDFDDKRPRTEIDIHIFQ